MHAVYPPASYAMLWPLMGCSTSSARGSAVGPGDCCRMARDCLDQGKRRRDAAPTRFCSALVAVDTATGFSIGHGQLTIYANMGISGGLNADYSGQRRWQDDLIVALFILMAVREADPCGAVFLARTLSAWHAKTHTPCHSRLSCPHRDCGSVSKL